MEELREEDALENPMEQFARWYGIAQSSGIPQPDAMALATATQDGRPSVRMVLLKGADERGFVFYSNYKSRKGAELEANPRAALDFFWPQLHRQIRIEGPVTRVSSEESDAYFFTRAPGSRVSAAASPQSQVVPDRGTVEQRVAELSAQYGDSIPRPTHWGGYRLVPEVIEFWQGRENRLHDRLRYRRTEHGAWVRERLAP